MQRALKIVKHAAALTRDRRGAAAAEMALMLPVLMLVMFGIFEFGRLVHDYHVINKGVRDAGRYLSRLDLSCPGAAVSAATLAEARNLAMTGNIGGGNILLYYWNDPTTVVVNTNCSATGGYAGAFAGDPEIASVVVTADVPFNFSFLAPFLDNPVLTMQARHQEVVIGE